MRKHLSIRIKLVLTFLTICFVSCSSHDNDDGNENASEDNTAFEDNPNLSMEKLPKDRVFADFESISYDVWRKAGFAMGNGPTKGSSIGTHEVTGYVDERLINSKFGSDEPTGTLISPTFNIENTFINFKIGGGEGNVGMRLFVNNREVYSTTGKYSDQLVWNSWDVKRFIGKSAKMEIFDHESGDWGFILIDQIVFSNKPVDI